MAQLTFKTSYLVFRNFYDRHFLEIMTLKIDFKFFETTPFLKKNKCPNLFASYIGITEQKPEISSKVYERLKCSILSVVNLSELRLIYYLITNFLYFFWHIHLNHEYPRGILFPKNNFFPRDNSSHRK